MSHFIATILKEKNQTKSTKLSSCNSDTTQMIQAILAQLIELPSQDKMPELGLESDRAPGFMVFNPLVGSSSEGSCVAL